MADYISELKSTLSTTEGTTLGIVWLVGAIVFIVAVIMLAAAKRKHLNVNKWTAALAAGGLFAVIANPLTYQFVTGKLPLIGGAFHGPEGPTPTGLVGHAAVFFLLSRVVM